MLEINIGVEIHCQRPIWGIKHSISKFTDSRYRIYINDNLITERSWIWDDNTFLYENIWIYGEHNADYTLSIEPVVYVAEQAKFRLDNFRITNMPADSTKVNDLQVNFSIR